MNSFFSFLFILASLITGQTQSHTLDFPDYHLTFTYPNICQAQKSSPQEDAIVTYTFDCKNNDQKNLYSLSITDLNTVTKYATARDGEPQCYCEAESCCSEFIASNYIKNYKLAEKSIKNPQKNTSSPTTRYQWGTTEIENYNGINYLVTMATRHPESGYSYLLFQTYINNYELSVKYGFGTDFEEWYHGNGQELEKQFFKTARIGFKKLKLESIK